LAFNNTGINNISLGRASLYCNTSGYLNVAIGRSALYENTTGYSNVVIGRSLINMVYGQYNVVIGQNSGINVGLTSSIGQTLIGDSAGNNITHGNNYQIAVGAFAQTSNAPSHTVWGNSGNSVYNCVWDPWVVPSDRRDKVNIEPIPNNLGLNFINRLNPVSFNWDQRQRYVDKCGFEYGKKDGTLVGEKKVYGLIAQEIKQVLDELEVQFDALKHNDDKDAYRFTYDALFAPIIKSIQELSNRIDELESKLIM
jgi:hypothetical protein